MRFSFDSTELSDLYENGYSANLRLHPESIKAFFKAMLHIEAVPNLWHLTQHRGFHVEKLHGDRRQQYSMRLNDQFRLIFTIERDADGDFLLLLEIADYH